MVVSDRLFELREYDPISRLEVLTHNLGGTANDAGLEVDPLTETAG